MSLILKSTTFCLNEKRMLCFYLYKIKFFSNLQGHPSKLGPIATVTWSGQQPFTVSEHSMLDFSTKYDNEYTCYIILSYMHESTHSYTKLSNEMFDKSLQM